MTFYTSTSKKSDIVKTVEDEKFTQIYTPDEKAVELADNKRSIRNTKAMLHAAALGIHSYSSGIHRVRTRIDEAYPCLGIRSPSMPPIPKEDMAGSYILTDSTYGWEGIARSIDGHSQTNMWNDRNINGHVWTITLNCDEHRISIIDENNKNQNEIEVDVCKAPLPWCLFVGLPRTLGAISLI